MWPLLTGFLIISIAIERYLCCTTQNKIVGLEKFFPEVHCYFWKFVASSWQTRLVPEERPLIGVVSETRLIKRREASGAETKLQLILGTRRPGPSQPTDSGSPQRFTRWTKFPVLSCTCLTSSWDPGLLNVEFTFLGNKPNVLGPSASTLEFRTKIRKKGRIFVSIRAILL